MKKTPENEKLEETLHSGRISAGGFISADKRSLDEIIAADLAELNHCGKTAKQIAARMTQITETAKAALGNWVKIDDNIEASVEHYQGRIICPWPHTGTYPKRITTIRKIGTNEKLIYSDLNIHLIQEHNFFEGKGAIFRIEPEEIVKMIFPAMR